MGQRNTDADAWFERYDNPLKDLVQQVQEAVLAVDERVGEAVVGSWIRAREPR